ncbi:MAG TPA: SpoIIE family protein phosphatase [Acidobacteriaceae bacterium]|nr:SpoIIE family protein phosphatase [Acidobacteriaceae bacterium]
MSTATPQPGTGFRAWYKRQSRIGRISFVLTCLILGMTLIGRLSHTANVVFAIPVIILCILVLSPLLIILFYRWLTRRFLWKVRNRLILTYALMSVAPVVLCLTLFAIASYLFAGQFATNSAITLLDQASTELRDETASLALFSIAKPSRNNESAAEPLPASPLPISIAMLKGDTFQQPTPNSAPGNPFYGQLLPSWLTSGYHGIVALQGKLYLCAFVAVPQGSRTLSILGTRPLDKSTLRDSANKLGHILVIPGFMGKNGGKDINTGKDVVNIHEDDNNVNINIGGSKVVAPDAGTSAEEKFEHIDVGTLPPRTHFFDAPVVFSAPLNVTSWQTGDRVRSIVAVFSRPSILYGLLFSTTNGLGSVIRIVLISIAVFFALLELFALLMAAGLSRTITHSVGELYRGTREIDRGNFEHRIVIKRRDQLGALASSFNGMTASIVDLMAQQREKERLLSELSIAREVQANLFPHSPVALPGFEIHAVCQPARTVSGDYFDFIIGRHGNDLCLALGDISGKGISAALLMASLHSAVRAFGLSTSDGRPGDAGLPSPATLLELLNKHIFASTPPEKYATLFLAYYDAATRKLTYSNGGHLPPMILCGDGTVKHLDCGGPPVGLFNGLKYSEDSIELKSGDLLMAFSDGLTEPEQNEEQFGEDRLFDYIREHRSEALPTLATNTLRRLQEWIGNHEQPDDMTLLLARQL